MSELGYFLYAVADLFLFSHVSLITTLSWSGMINLEAMLGTMGAGFNNN